MTYLTLELFVSGEITVMAEGLLQEGQQDGDNDARLQRLTEQDEEDLREQGRVNIVFNFSGLVEKG